MLFIKISIVAAQVLFVSYAGARLHAPRAVTMSSSFMHNSMHMPFQGSSSNDNDDDDDDSMGQFHNNNNYNNDDDDSSGMNTTTDTMMLNVTACDDGYLRFPGCWKDDVCFGAYDKCCYKNSTSIYHNFTACPESQIPHAGMWDMMGGYCHSNDVSNCCGTPEQRTDCNSTMMTTTNGSLEPRPGVWMDGVCFGLITDCCYDNDGMTYHHFSTCLDNHVQIPGMWNDNARECIARSMSSCCAPRQNITDCGGSVQPMSNMWQDGVCFGLVEECSI